MKSLKNRTLLRYKITLLIADKTNDESSKIPILQEILNRLDLILKSNSIMIPRYFQMQDKLRNLIQITISQLYPIITTYEANCDTPFTHIWRLIQRRAYSCMYLTNLIINNLQTSSTAISKVKEIMLDPRWIRPTPPTILWIPTKTKIIIKVARLSQVNNPDSELLFHQLRKDTEAIELAKPKFRSFIRKVSIINSLLQELNSTSPQPDLNTPMDC